MVDCWVAGFGVSRNSRVLRLVVVAVAKVCGGGGGSDDVDDACIPSAPGKYKGEAKKAIFDYTETR